MTGIEMRTFSLPEEHAAFIDRMVVGGVRFGQ